MHPIPPYGVAVTQAIASGDLDTMRQVAEQAEAHLNQHGDIAQLLSICLQMSGVVFRGLEPVKAARQDGDEGNPDERDQACVRSFEDRVQSAVAAEPGKRPLDDPSKAGRNEGAFCATGLGVDGNTQVKALSLQGAASIRQVTKRFAAKSTRRYRFETWKDTRRVMSIGRRYNNG
jgi:hypothetical protein